MPLAFACLMSHDILTRRTWPVISATQMLIGFVYRSRSTCVLPAGAVAATFEVAQPIEAVATALLLDFAQNGVWVMYG